MEGLTLQQLITKYTNLLINARAMLRENRNNPTLVVLYQLHIAEHKACLRKLGHYVADEPEDED